MRFIGDVHGKFKVYAYLIKGFPASIQLGDMGIGFPGKAVDYEQKHFPDNPTNFFIRGNHDNPEACRKKQSYLGDFGYLEAEKIFFVSGAWSVDRHLRIEGVSWWPDEELTNEQAEAALALYKKVRPPIVASHECPNRAHEKLDIYYNVMRSRTALLLDAMLEIAEPQVWVFGHHHQNRSFQLGKTAFHALGELDVFNL
jgi:hypothetical protein